ncbi:MAG TPA: hypothetical protein VH640_29210 [Bryobacteraceae bacterium]
MNGYEVNYIAEFTAVGGSHDFVRSEVNRMQHITEGVVLHHWKRAELAVHNPFKVRLAGGPGNFRRIDRRFAPYPSDAIPGLFKRLRIAGASGGAFLPAMKNIDVPGIARRIRFNALAPAT